MHFNRSLRHGLPLAMFVLLVVLSGAFHLATLSELQRHVLADAKSDALHDAAALARAAGLARDEAYRLVGAEVAAMAPGAAAEVAQAELAALVGPVQRSVRPHVRETWRQ